MPYFLHTSDNLPQWHDGQSASRLRELTDMYEENTLFPQSGADALRTFEDAKTANACRQALVRAEPDRHWSAVVYIPTVDDMRIWRQREKDRLAGTLPYEYDKDGRVIIYRPVPWANDDWYATPYDREMDMYALQYRHYAHMSRVIPGQVAFTPSEEYGVQNRKTRMTVARYLEKFAKYDDGSAVLTAKQIVQYVALVKAHADLTLRLAQTADEIVKVYLHGPHSCMAHSPNHYSTSGVHPVSVYADSDLAVAYCGHPDDGVSARSVVWPEKKIYTRIYGDMTLEHVLQQNGYERGTLGGATIPAVRPLHDSDAYMLPYIDAAESADLVEISGRSYFRLRDSENTGQWSVKTTNGLAELREPDFTCSHCDEWISADRHEDSGYCNSCEENRWICSRCENESFDRDDEYCVDDDSYCKACYRHLFDDCSACGEAFAKSENRASKRDRDVLDYCNECSEDRMICDTCGELVDNEPDDTTCKKCKPAEPEETEPETNTTPTEDTE